MYIFHDQHQPILVGIFMMMILTMGRITLRYSHGGSLGKPPDTYMEVDSWEAHLQAKQKMVI